MRRAQAVDDRAALHDVAVQAIAAKIEEAVAQADVFRIFLIAEYRQRQFGRRSDSTSISVAKTSTRPVGKLGVVGACRARRTLPSTRITHSERSVSAVLKAGLIRIGHDLRHAVMVAQVDEQQAAMVANPMAPAGQTDGLPDVGVAQRAASVGAIAMHR